MEKSVNNSTDKNFSEKKLAHPPSDLLHFREVDKLDSKWSNFTKYYSTNLCTKAAKFFTRLSKLTKKTKKKL